MSERTHEWTWSAAFRSAVSRPAAEKHPPSRLEEETMNWREYLPMLSMLLPTILIVFAVVISVGA